MTIIALILGEYYFLRQRLPIFLYVFYTHFKEVDNPIIDSAINASLAATGLITLYTFIGFILKIPFTRLIPFRWHYPGLLTWLAFILVYYHISLRSNLNRLTSFTLTALATVGGGWLYEVPFFSPLGMFLNHNSIFYLNGQIICLLLLAYELKKMNFKPNKPIYATLILFIIYSTLIFYNMMFMKHLPDIWFMRIPTCLFLISLLGGINISKRVMTK